MRQLSELRYMRQEFEELSDLPIEDFVDWGGIISILDELIAKTKRINELEGTDGFDGN